MEPRPRQSGDIQRNANTVLLSLCTAAVIWMAKGVNDLEIRMGQIETSTRIYNDANGKTQEEVNRNGTWISDLQIRMSRVELLIQEKK